jgi:hypothetical protein
MLTISRRKNMEKNIVNELNEKYGISKFIINLMLRDTMAKGYSLEEAKKTLCVFLDERYKKDRGI